jgi:hypothetical protein
MRVQILYVELKSGYSDDGPAWIGKGFFSKTGRTIYFNGQVFQKENGIRGNHFDLENGDEYWISGIKSDGTDRHWAGSGIIQIDESIIEEYLKQIGETVLPRKKFKIVHLDNEPAKQKANEIENQKSKPKFDHSIIFKKPNDLSDNELNSLIKYYNNLDLTAIPKKSRKEYINTKNALQDELINRKNPSTE